jgi:hypothetical protein
LNGVKKIEFIQSMKSNKKYHFAFKFAFLIFGLLTWTIPIFSWIAPNHTEINGENGSIDFVTTVILCLIGLIFILLFFAVKDKFAIVEIGNQDVKIIIGYEVKSVGWFDIDSLKQIQFVFPPLYSLKIKDSDETIWFTTEARFISINGFIIDNSEMGELITKKKRELGI